MSRRWGRRSGIASLSALVTVMGGVWAVAGPLAGPASATGAGPVLSILAGVNRATSNPLLNSTLDAGAIAVDSSSGVIYFVGDNDVEALNPATGVVTVVAGSPDESCSDCELPSPGPATSAVLDYPRALAVDSAGDLFIADGSLGVVEEVVAGPNGTVADGDGMLSVVAGGGTSWAVAGGGENGASTPVQATASHLYNPDALAIDADGDLFIADAGSYEVMEVMPAAGDTLADGTGMLSVVAGTDGGGQSSGQANQVALGEPTGIAVDGAGDLFIAGSSNNTVDEVTPDGTGTVADGTGTLSILADDLDNPQGVWLDGDGDLLIDDEGADQLDQLAPGTDDSFSDGVLSTLASTSYGAVPTPGPIADNGLPGLDGLAVDSSGDIFAVLSSFGSEHIAEVVPDADTGLAGGILSRLAGADIEDGQPTPGPATSSELEVPTGVAVDSSGDVFIADPSNDTIDEVDPSGQISMVAGGGSTSLLDAGDSGPLDLDLGYPQSVAVDAEGDLFFTSSDGVVAEILPGTDGWSDATVSVVAGNGQYGEPTAGPATDSDLAGPAGLTVDAQGDLFIADGNAVDEVTPQPGDSLADGSGELSIIAGVPGQNGAPTPGPAAASELGYAAGVAVDGAGDLFIADSYANVVEEITPAAEGLADGTLSVIAGDGTSGDPTPGPATSSALDAPDGIAVDGAGDVFVSAYTNSYTRLVEEITPGTDGLSDATLSVIAGNGYQGLPTPGPAIDSMLGGRVESSANGISAAASGMVYFTDPGNADVEALAFTPDPPTGVTATSGPGRATVSWTPPVRTGGDAITGYTVTAAPGGASVTADGDATSATVTGLTGGIAYTFTVTAANVVGAGDQSVASSPVTPTPPREPSSPSSTAPSSSPSPSASSSPSSSASSSPSSSPTAKPVKVEPGSNTSHSVGTQDDIDLNLANVARGTTFVIEVGGKVVGHGTVGKGGKVQIDLTDKTARKKTRYAIFIHGKKVTTVTVG